jgi:hypothetical protein
MYSHTLENRQMVIGLPFKIIEKEREKFQKPPQNGKPQPKPAYKFTQQEVKLGGRAMVNLELQDGHDFAACLIDPAVFKVSPRLEARFADWATTYQLSHMQEYSKHLVTASKDLKAGAAKLDKLARQRYFPRWLICAHLPAMM